MKRESNATYAAQQVNALPAREPVTEASASTAQAQAIVPSVRAQANAKRKTFLSGFTNAVADNQVMAID